MPSSVKKRFLRLVIVIIIIYVILTFTRCQTTKEEEFVERVPKVITERIENPGAKCAEEKFNWTYNWEGWNQVSDDTISVKFRLTNLEGKQGTFSVDFAFFDDRVHPFQKFEGLDYELVSEQLPWQQASMWVDGITRSLEPYESISLTSATKKADLDGVYWAYADVAVPTYTVCDPRYQEINKTIMVDQTKTRTITVTKTLWQILSSKT